MTKTAIICNCIIRVVMIAGITAAAIYFSRIAVLWFYLLPACMGFTAQSGGSIDYEHKA